jgi:hypothetical protein
MRADPAVGGLQTTLTVRSRPAMSSGTAPSMMAIARAPSLEGRLRSVVINRAMLCADGFFCGPAAGDMASASRRRRVDLRNTSVRPPRTIWRTMPRDLLMRRTISVDRHASLCQREHGGILVLALDPAVILAPLGRRKKCRVHDTGPECLADFLHGLLDRAEKGSARVFHQMPAVGDLHSFRSALGRRLHKPSPAVAGDDGDGWVLGKPFSDGRGLPVGQDVDDPPLFQIADDRPVAMTPLQAQSSMPTTLGALVGSAVRRLTTVSQSIFADRDDQPPCEALSRPPT